jgi:hypothetical protein
MLGLAPHAAEQTAIQEDWFYVEIQEAFGGPSRFPEGRSRGRRRIGGQT